MNGEKTRLMARNFRRNFSLLQVCLILGPFTTLCLASSNIRLGIDYLQDREFDILQNKRVGLLTHPAGVNSLGKSTVLTLHNASKVNLVALFGPEHGIYGDEKASVPVDDKIDHRTNLPVYSLYGKFRKPTSKMLGGLDCLVIDLQDVGVRCYTYISCMRYVMEACFEEGVEVVVLDRPTSNVDMPSSTALSGRKVMCKPCPASKKAVVNSREDTERRLPMVVISKCENETRILVRFARRTSTIFGKFWQVLRAPSRQGY